MAITFAKYERAESTLESLGTVMDLVGKDGKLGIIPKNFKDSSKRVVIILTKKNGTSAQVTCSEAVSKGLRDASIELGNLLSFEVLEGEAGAFISLPSSGLVEVAVKSLTVVDYVPTAIPFAELIG